MAARCPGRRPLHQESQHLHGQGCIETDSMPWTKYKTADTNNTKESHVENIRVLPKLGGEKYENTIIYVSTLANSYNVAPFGAVVK